VGAGYDPRVLEPSPPAVNDGMWFADDPAVGGDVDWNEWVKQHPQHSDWAADRWLAAYRRLGPLPPSFRVPVWPCTAWRSMWCRRPASG
jgi:hypothetical protein